MTFMIKKDNVASAILRVMKENFLSQKRIYAVAVVAMIMVAATTSATAWIMKAIFDVLSTEPNAWPAVVVAGMVLAIFMGKGIAGYIQQVALSKAGNRVVADIQRRLFRKLLQQEAAWFDVTESSDILVRLTQSAQAARSMIDIIVTSFVRDALTLCGLIAVMIWQQATLSAVFLVIGPLALFGVRSVLGRVRLIMQAELVSFTEILKVIQETAAGLRVVRAFGLESLLEARMDRAVSDVERRSNAIVRLESVTAPMMDTLAGTAIATIVLVSGLSVSLGTKATPGELMAFITALLMAYEPAKRLSRMRVTLESAFVGVRMMFEILDRPDAMLDQSDAIGLPETVGELALRNVSFSYDGVHNVLNELSLTFPTGKMTALVGPSGGGKSTIMSLLLRLYDPSLGAVEIGRVDLRKIKRRSLQAQTAYVGQNTFLFATSVRENIRMGRRDATDEEVEVAARAAQAHEFIVRLPQGYETHIGENGIFLSGGQRQRLSLARAIVKDAPILLLDEATSALDNESEWLVREAIAKATRGRTTIIIAHRLSTIMAADEIAFIKSGRLIEQGPLNALLDTDSHFAALFQREFRSDKLDQPTNSKGTVLSDGA
jgi:ABC-type multidrug transport system fused ATPase/permease subunit